MKTAQRILVTFLVAILYTLISGRAVNASEIDTVAAPQVVVAKENNLDKANPTEDTLEDTLEDTNQPLQSYIDEDGQLFVLDVIDELGEAHYIKADPADVEAPEENEAPSVETTALDETAIIDETVKLDTKDTEQEIKKPTYSKKDLRLLASLIYAEAGNQSYQGMLAVANVVLNRVESNVYWHVNTIKEAIYDKKWSVQFAVTVKNKKTGVSMLDKALKNYDTGKFSGGNPDAEAKAMKQAISAAIAALEGDNNIGDYLCFQNKRSASKIKKKHKDNYKIVGDHIFYRTK